MTEIGSNIKRLRKEAGMTQSQLAERLNVVQRTVASWESGDRAPGLDTVKEMAKLFGVETDYLLGVSDSPTREPAPLPRGLTPIADMPHHYIPMLGSVAAGRPLYMETNYDCYVDSVREADFALTVCGDSMNPTYLDGDVVYIKAVSDVDDGQVCVVAVDDSATLKHLYHLPDGVQLTSDNPAYPPMIYTSENTDSLRVLGVPVGYTRLYRRSK